MAGSRRKSKAAAISYQEVDSDIDMQDEDRLVRVQKTIATAKKQPRKIKKARGKRAPLEAFLNMPFDIFSEITRHLRPEDLVNLSRTSMLFRRLLHSDAARGIWSKYRTYAGAPKLDYIDEPTYVRLLFTRICSGCNQEHPTKLLWGVLTRLCLPCRQKLLIAQHNVRSAMPHLHPETVNAAHFTFNGPTMSDRAAQIQRRVYYLRSELEALSPQLHELQDEDDLREFVRPSKRSRGTRSRPTADADLEETTAVATLVEERQAMINKPHSDVMKISEIVSSYGERQMREWWKQWERKGELRRANKAIAQNYAEDLIKTGWTAAELKELDRSYLYHDLFLPESSPEDDTAAWAEVREQFVDIKTKGDEERALAEAQQTRKARIKEYYIDLELGTAGEDIGPGVYDFLELPDVRLLWKPKDAVFDHGVWDAALEDIEDDLEAFREGLRVQAIRMILSATSDVPISTLSKRPVDYPRSVYDEDFFARPTSHFFEVTQHYGPSPFYPRLPDTYQFEAWPLAVNMISHWQRQRRIKGLKGLRGYTGPRHVLIIRALLAAADLDEVTASVEDLDNIGACFRWLEHRGKGSSKRKWEWKPLLTTILRRMPVRQKPYTVPTIVVEDMADQQEYSDDELSGDESA